MSRDAVEEVSRGERSKYPRLEARQYTNIIDNELVIYTFDVQPSCGIG